MKEMKPSHDKAVQQLFRSNPQLNKTFPTARNKDHTYIVDFASIEHSLKGLNLFEQEVLSSIAVHPEIDSVIFSIDLAPFVESLPPIQRAIFNSRLDGFTQAEIAEKTGVARKTVNVHLKMIRGHYHQTFMKG